MTVLGTRKKLVHLELSGVGSMVGGAVEVAAV